MGAARFHKWIKENYYVQVQPTIEPKVILPVEIKLHLHHVLHHECGKLIVYMHAPA